MLAPLGQILFILKISGDDIHPDKTRISNNEINVKLGFVTSNFF